MEEIVTDRQQSVEHGTGPLRRLNLNLLYALDAILRARTVTEAGRMVSLSQPAMSMALRRLRIHFGDDLVAHRGGGRQLTELGEALQGRVGRVLREASDTFAFSVDFDPVTATRSIALAAPEAIELMFLSRVVPHILRVAPNLDVRLAAFDYESTMRMFERGVDVAIVPESMVDPQLASRPLFRHDVAGMIWKDHPHFGTSLSREDYLGGRHAALLEDVEQASSFGTTPDPILAERRIVVRTRLHSMLPGLVIGTELIVTTSNWLTQYFESIVPVRLVDLPLPARPHMLVAQWLPHRTNEPMIRWLLAQIADRIP